MLSQVTLDWITITEYENEPPDQKSDWHHIVDLPLNISSGLKDANDELISKLTGNVVLRWKLKKLEQFKDNYGIDAWPGVIDQLAVIKSGNLANA